MKTQKKVCISLRMLYKDIAQCLQFSVTALQTVLLCGSICFILSFLFHIHMLRVTASYS